MKRILLLALSLLASTTALARSKGPEVTEQFSKTYSLSANGTVDISNMNGRVEVVAWDRDEVSVEAEKFSREEDGLKRIEIIIDSSNDRLVIKTKHHRDEDRSWWRGNGNNTGGVRYKLRVPAALASFKADVMNASVTIDGVRGRMKINSMNGRITATGLRSDADLDTMNGAITASFDSIKSGQEISLNTMNGSCQINVPRDTSASFHARSANGRISCDLPITLEKSGRHSLHGTIGQGGATINLRSMNGGLTLRST